MIRTLMLLLMVVSGVALGLQIVMNTRVRTALDSPAMGAAVSLTVSVVTVSLLIAFGLVGGTGNAPAGFRSVWFGGVCGAFYLVAFVIAMPRIGVAATVCATVLGQQLISLCFDTFGWLGTTKVPLTPSRLIGAGLLFAGVVLLQRRTN